MRETNDSRSSQVAEKCGLRSCWSASEYADLDPPKTYAPSEKVKHYVVYKSYVVSLGSYLNWCEVDHVVAALLGHSKLSLPGVDMSEILCKHGLALKAVERKHFGVMAGTENRVHQKVAATTDILTKYDKERRIVQKHKIYVT